MEAKKRFTFIDLLKGWALLIMIEVHVVNAFIIPEITYAPWFSIVDFINGLVAPSFTFISGFAFIISSKNSLEELRSFGKKFWTKLGRILLLFVVGYSLHMPEFSLQNIIKNASPESLKLWANSDVLQCIALSLLIMFLSRLAIKSDKVYNRFLLIMAIGIPLASPLVWNIDFAEYLPLAAAAYFNEVNGSFFPIFPWMGFLFAGGYACTLYMKFREEGKEEVFINRGMIYGIAAFAISTIVIIFLRQNPGFQVKPNPFFFIQRLGLVFFALGLCWKYVNRFGEKSSFVTVVSRESLLIYFLHLQVIYRRIWNGQNLESLIGHSFGIPEVVFATLILVTSMIAVGKIWGSFKQQFPALASLGVKLTIGISILVFLIIT